MAPVLNTTLSWARHRPQATVRGMAELKRNIGQRMRFFAAKRKAEAEDEVLRRAEAEAASSSGSSYGASGDSDSDDSGPEALAAARRWVVGDAAREATARAQPRAPRLLPEQRRRRANPNPHLRGKAAPARLLAMKRAALGCAFEQKGHVPLAADRTWFDIS